MKILGCVTNMINVVGEKDPLAGNIVVVEISGTPENNNNEFIKNLREFCIEKLEEF